MKVSVSYKIDTKKAEQLLRVVPGRADEKVRLMAYDLEADIKDNFTSPSPSSPGGPPAVDTGTLKNSIRSEKIRDKVWRVLAGVLYAIYLEFGTRRMGARPFMGPAVERLTKKITSYFKDLTDV